MADYYNYNDNEIIGSKGVKKVEFIRLIGDALYSFGYKKTVEDLEKESAITLYSALLNQFSQQILNANWDESLISLSKLPVLDQSVINSTSFVILEQKFLHLLDINNRSIALLTLRTEISPLKINPNRVRDLSSLLFGFGQLTVKPKPRSEVLEDLKMLLPPNVMIPDERLLRLVEQALDSQYKSCSFHNSLTGNSNNTDHYCGKDQIPSQTVQILREHEDEIWFLQFSHNGKFLGSTSRDRSAIIYDVNINLDGKLSVKHKLSGHETPVSCLAWSPNDENILTCGEKDVIMRWDVITGDYLCVYRKENIGLLSCCWSPDGNRVFSGATDKSVIMWDLDGNELESWPHQKTVMMSDLNITGDGRCLISLCREYMINIFDLSPLGDEKRIYGNANIISFTVSEDKEFLLLSLMNQEIHLWRINGQMRLITKYRGHKVSRFVVRACFGGLNEAFVASGSQDSQVFIWYKETGELLMTLSGHSGTVNCTSWNPANPHMLASASDDRTIRIWGLKSEPC